jgi:phosphatidylglycerophosphate synthase
VYVRGIGEQVTYGTAALSQGQLKADTMLDPVFRPLMQKPLDAAGRWLAGMGLSANQVTLAGLGLGLAAAIAIALGAFAIGLLLFLLSRIADGLDGAVARATTPTDQGGFLDIALDFFVYAAIPLAFAVYDPSSNAFSAALLLASFLANGSVFLAFAILAEKRALVSDRDSRSIYYIGGIAEGSETIAFFAAFCLFPSAFPVLALIFGIICIVSAIARARLGWKKLA